MISNLTTTELTPAAAPNAPATPSASNNSAVVQATTVTTESTNRIPADKIPDQPTTRPGNNNPNGFAGHDAYSIDAYRPPENVTTTG